MSSTNSPPLQIDVHARRAQPRIATATLAATIAALALTAGSGRWVAAACVLPLIGLIAYGMRRHGWLGGSSRLTRLTWTAGDDWLLEDRTGACYSAGLCADTRIAGRWCWLSWRLADAASRPSRRRLLLGPHDAPEDQLRRLAIRLHRSRAQLDSVYRRGNRGGS